MMMIIVRTLTITRLPSIGINAKERERHIIIMIAEVNMSEIINITPFIIIIVF